MTTFYDVPANFLIPALAEQLKSNASIQMPDWADVVKTGSSRERPPTQDDWWHTRGAAILRKIARQGRLASRTLTRVRWTKEQRSQAKHPGVGSRKVIRILVQQLEDAGLVATDVGRSLNQKVENQHNSTTAESSPLLDKNSSTKLPTVSALRSKQHILVLTNIDWK